MTLKVNLSHIRNEYMKADLDELAVPSEPATLFSDWLSAAVESGLAEYTAMTLATCGRNMIPSLRVVLLKEFTADGVVWYTNYESAKAREVSENPVGSLLFFWPELERQIRIVGPIKRTSRLESEAYFASRPRESQVAAVVSHQSAVVASRNELENAFQELEAEFDGREVPCPDNWGGYRLTPTEYEFWQGRRARLHDRIRFRMQADGTWIIERLAP